MIQEEAIERIAASLKQDNCVQAVFLKGSFGRGEHDEHSDIDLYCLVDEKDKDNFLQRRIQHLEAYRNLLFYDDIFIIAPQIIGVYDNMLHVDLFTVTEETFKEKDFIKVVYDPNHRLDKYIATQNLTLSKSEFADDAMDVVWFLFQYRKSAARGNDIWSVSMLNAVVTYLARVLLHHYKPDRAQLGLKTIEASIPAPLLDKLIKAIEHITPNQHKVAVKQLVSIIHDEYEWIFSTLDEKSKIKLQPFFEKILGVMQ